MKCLAENSTSGHSHQSLQLVSISLQNNVFLSPLRVLLLYCSREEGSDHYSLPSHDHRQPNYKAEFEADEEESLRDGDQPEQLLHDSGGAS